MKAISVIVVIVVIVVASGVAAGQRSVKDLEPEHATVIEKLLATDRGKTFRAETNLSEIYLMEMRYSLMEKLLPNYAKGDFNGDKVQDFAVLLNRAGKPSYKYSPDKSGVTEHSPDYPLVLMVFNGSKRGGFVKAFEQPLMGPNAAFVYTDREAGRDTLRYSVYETDSDTFSLQFTRGRYVVKSESL